jgi:inner membrane protein
MDNVCHTLVGAACGAAGLNRRTRFGAAALMISANLPDVDVLVFATDTPWIAFRRGWTHGIAAQLLLPIGLMAALFVLDRYKRRRGLEGHRPFHAGWLLVLAYVGVYSHVFLDYLNTYGVRLATPVSWRWFYGDALFVVDPLMWLVPAVGLWLTGMQGRSLPARAALLGTAGYIVLMLLSTRVADSIVENVWTKTRAVEPRAIMVGPLPLSPFSRQVIVDAGDHYERGTFSFWRAAVTFDPEPISKNDERPEVAAALCADNVRAFLVWARFPFWTIESSPNGTRVTVSDLRFMGRNGFFASTMVVGGKPSHQ